MTSGQETEQVYSYNPGARTGRPPEMCDLLYPALVKITTASIQTLKTVNSLRLSLNTDPTSCQHLCSYDCMVLNKFDYNYYYYIYRQHKPLQQNHHKTTGT